MSAAAALYSGSLLGLAHSLSELSQRSNRQPTDTWPRVLQLTRFCPCVATKSLHTEEDAKLHTLRTEALRSIQQSPDSVALDGSFPVDDRSEEAVLAVGSYLLASKCFKDRLLPFLLRYLVDGPFLKWRSPFRVTSVYKSQLATSDMYWYLDDEKSMDTMEQIPSFSTLRLDCPGSASSDATHPAEPFAMALTCQLHEIACDVQGVQGEVDAAVLACGKLCLDILDGLEDEKEFSARRHVVVRRQAWAFLVGMLRAIGSADCSVPHSQVVDDYIKLCFRMLSVKGTTHTFNALVLRVVNLILSSQASGTRLLKSSQYTELFRKYASPVFQLFPSISIVNYKTRKRRTKSYHPTVVTAEEQRMNIMDVMFQAVLTAVNCTISCPSLLHECEQQLLALLTGCLDPAVTKSKGSSGSSQQHKTRHWRGSITIARTVLSGLAALCQHYPARVPAIVEYLEKILLSSTRLAAHPQVEGFRESMTATVASVLKHELGAGATPYSSSHTRRFVFSLLNSLYQDKAKQSRAGSSLLQRSLLLLTKVTLLVNRHEVTEQVVPVLTQYFDQHKKQLYLVVHNLADLALEADDTDVFDALTTLFTATYEKLFEPDNSHNMRAIPEALQRMALTLEVLQSSGMREVASPSAGPLATPTASPAADAALTVPAPAMGASAVPPGDSGSGSGGRTGAAFAPLARTLSGARKQPFGALANDAAPSLLNRRLSLSSTTESMASAAAAASAAVAIAAATAGSTTDTQGASDTSREAIEVKEEINTQFSAAKALRLRRCLLKKLLKLFIELAVELNDQSPDSKSYEQHSLGHVTVLLPAIAALLSRESDEEHGTDVPQTHDAEDFLLELSEYHDLGDAESSATPTQSGPISTSSAESTLLTGPVGITVYANSDHNVVWFRRLWMCLVSYEYDAPLGGALEPRELEATQGIAAHTPVLISRSAHKAFGAELTNTANGLGISQNVLLRVRKKLARAFPQHSRELAYLDLGPALFLAAVHRLETLRVSSRRFGYFFGLFQYLGSEVIRTAGLLPYMEAICDEVFGKYVDFIASCENRSGRWTALQIHASFLIDLLAHRVLVVRSKAHSYLQKLTTRFPHLQWSKRCLARLLDLAQTVADSVREEHGLWSLDSPGHVLASGANTRKSIGSPLRPRKQRQWFEEAELQPVDSEASSSRAIQLSSQRSVRVEVLAEVSEKCSTWLRNAHYLVPTHTVAIVSEYILYVQRQCHANLNSPIPLRLPLPFMGDVSSNTHAGMALALRVLSSDRQPYPKTQTQVPTLLAAVGIKERYLGEVEALYVRHVEVTPDEPFCATLASRYVKGFKALLVQVKRKQGADDKRRRRKSPQQQSPSSKQSMESLEAALQHLLLQSAALLVWATQGSALPRFASRSRPLATSVEEKHRHANHQTLLHMICKAPAKFFSASGLRSAVFAWEWLFETSRSLALLLLVEMKASWGYCVDRRLGLFCGADDNKDEEGKPSQCVPHDIWALFLAERFSYIALHTHTKSILNILALMLHKAFARADFLSHHRDSFHARFTLILLGLRVVQGGSSDLDARDKVLFRERLYNAAFHWFQRRPSWFNPNKSDDSVRRDAKLITDVCKALQLEDKYWNVDSKTSVDDRTALAHRGMDNIHALPLSLTAREQKDRSLGHRRRATVAGPGPSALRKGRSMTYSGGQPVHLQTRGDVSTVYESRETGSATGSSGSSSRRRVNSAVPGHSHGYTDTMSRKTQSDDSASGLLSNGSQKLSTRHFKRFRELLVLLLCHELDRFSVWHHPTQTREEVFPDELLFTATRSMRSKVWNRRMKTAWAVDPLLTIRMAQRFSHVPAVKKTISALVQANPQKVYDVPDAVVYMLSPERLEISANELGHLMYWAPCSIAVAVKMLNPPYVHYKQINEYAVHSLRHHPVEEVVFFLPQLIQCLRHDSEQSLYTFMVEAAETSVLLSHQLIWHCQAELGSEEADDTATKTTEVELKEPDAHVAVVERLIGDLKQSMKPAERAYFMDEFQFFEDITAICSVLKPVAVPGNARATKELRKARIREELKAIPVDVQRKLYLPTNPTAEIVDIVTTSGTPMQSAAKVPILVAFKVQPSPLEKTAPNRKDTLVASAPALRSQSQVDSDVMSDMVDSDMLDDDLDEPVRGPALGHRHHSVRSITSLQSHGSVDTARAIKLQASSSGGNPTESQNDMLEMKEIDSEHKQSQQSGSDGGDDGNADEEEKLVDPSSVYLQACIFKVDDDCRQDALALQIMQKCKNIFQSVGIELFVYPYRVLPSRIGNSIGGVIECVPNAKTRDELGKANPCSLKSHFLLEFGREEGPAYQEAQRNFILSLAGYAILSYILQVKDRHNGNLMIDNKGHVVHIDFGFIFDISPGKDMRFERAGFKLTSEMVEIMGDSQNSPLYKWFVHLVVQGFLAVREHMDEFIALSAPMVNCGIGCFKPNSIANLRSRFFPEKSEKAAARAIIQMVSVAYNNFRTNTYDYIQHLQQGIFYWRGDVGKAPQ